MAEDQRDKNVDSALSIIDTQQKIVGQALVGASGATLAEKQEESYEVLEHLRQLGSKSLKGIQSVANTLIGMFKFDQDEARRRRDQASELKKEQQDKISSEENPDVPGQTDSESKKDGAGLGAMAFLGNFLGRIPGVGAIKKLLAPILGFFGKSGVLFKLFGRFGPFAALTLAIGFVIRYTDEIAKALAPVVDGAKAVIKALEPLLKALMAVVDVVVKSALLSIGTGLEVGMGLLVASVETFMNSLKFVAALFKGLFTGDFQLIKDAFMEFISLDAFVKIFKKLGATIGDAFKGLINGIGEIFGFEKLFDFVSQLFTDFVSYIGTKLKSFGNMLISFVQGAIDFVMFIPRKIMSGFSFIKTTISDFVTSLPDRIMNAVKSLFAPIFDFFSNIGNRIKQAVNGIIDSLPFPDFVKDKMKFDIKEPDKQIKNYEDTLPEKNERFFDDIEKNKDEIIKFEKAGTGYTFDLASTKALYTGAGGGHLVFKNAMGETSLANPYDFNAAEHADFLKSGEKIRIKPRLNKSGEEIKYSDMNNAPPVVITRGGDTVTNSNVAKTDFNNSPLNVNVDNYHDRMSVATF